MVIKNTKSDKLLQGKKFAKNDTSYSSFWLFNKERDINSEHFKDSFVNFYNDKELLSEFNPTVAKNIISFWSNPKDLIYDPFSGRTRALVSYAMDRMYIGSEISSDVVKYMTTKFEELQLFKQDNFFVDIINDDCKNINKYYSEEEFDLIFSCPPYWNLEKYQSCDGQLSDIKEYDNFILELSNRLNIAVSKLKLDKYMCLVVGDFRRNKTYIPFHVDLIKSMEQNKNLKLHDVITIQNLPFNTAAFYFGARKKHKYTAKAHEYLLVWKKV
jgi:DNA modification methylase